MSRFDLDQRSYGLAYQLGNSSSNGTIPSGRGNNDNTIAFAVIGTFFGLVFCICGVIAYTCRKYGPAEACSKISETICDILCCSCDIFLCCCKCITCCLRGAIDNGREESGEVIGYVETVRVEMPAAVHRPHIGEVDTTQFNSAYGNQ